MPLLHELLDSFQLFGDGLDSQYQEILFTRTLAVVLPFTPGIRLITPELRFWIFQIRFDRVVLDEILFLTMTVCVEPVSFSTRFPNQLDPVSKYLRLIIKQRQQQQQQQQKWKRSLIYQRILSSLRTW